MGYESNNGRKNKMTFLEHKRENIKTLTSSTKNEGTTSEGTLQRHQWKLFLSIQPTTKTLNGKKKMVNNSYLLFLFIEYLSFQKFIII